jgi:hypothetical protein
MGKVIFKFDENKDNYDLKIIYNRSDIIDALEQIDEYRRNLCKGYPDNEIIVKDKKVIAEGTEILQISGDVTGNKSYIPVSDVEEFLNQILSKIRYLWLD